jgi:hypothetical protein
MNAFRACSLLLPSYGFRSIANNSTKTSTLRAIGDRFGVKHRSRRFLRNYLLFNGLVIGGGSLYYYFYLTTKERRQIRVTFEGFQRGIRFVYDFILVSIYFTLFNRSFRIGLLIAFDYKYLFWKIPESSPEYINELKECHKRAAARIADGCIDNGGLYVKMGQGLVTADHILPKEYCDGLRRLQDKALRRQRNEVSLQS